jgi:hypothetical protein
MAVFLSAVVGGSDAISFDKSYSKPNTGDRYRAKSNTRTPGGYTQEFTQSRSYEENSKLAKDYLDGYVGLIEDAYEEKEGGMNMEEHKETEPVPKTKYNDSKYDPINKYRSKGKYGASN